MTLPPIRLHEHASVLTLAAARVYVFAIFFVRLVFEPVERLGYLPAGLFHPQGIMRLLPASWWEALIQPTTLVAFKWLLLVVVALVILGAPGRRAYLVMAVVGLTAYWGLTKGLGGHVNHRELVLLYLSYALAVLPCFGALTIGSPEPVDNHDPDYPRAAMVALCAIVVLNYLFVGLARLALGFPVVFHPAVMQGWLLDRAVRPNPVGSTLALTVLDNTLMRAAVAVALPVSTVLEIAAPVLLWARRWWKAAMLLSLAGFHIMIFLLMNIAFFENVLLLVLFVDLTPILERVLGTRSTGVALPGAANETVNP